MSPGRTARRAWPIASISPATVRAADRGHALSFANIRSIGLRSGLDAGRDPYLGVAFVKRLFYNR